MNKQEIMQAAWALFREKYHYPAVPFRSIGRACFGWCLREVYRRAREAARIAAIPADIKAARIASLHRKRELAAYADSYQTTLHIVAECDAELALLAA